MDKLTLYLVRHGQTVCNAENRFSGWNDTPLNDIGKKQAQELSKRLKDIKFEAVYSSDLSRAYETATAVSNESDIILFEQLREVNFGRWCGLNKEEIQLQFSDEWKSWSQDWQNYKITDGETAQEAMIRANICIDEIIGRHKKGNVLIVAHGGVLRGVLAHLLDLDFDQSWHFQFNNAEYTTINIMDDYSVMTGFNL